MPRISSINNVETIHFSAQHKKHKRAQDKNVITQKGEAALLAKGTFIAGLALGGKLLFEIFEDSTILEDTAEKAEELVNRNHKHLKGGKKALMSIGATVGLLAAAVSGFALLYTLLNTPKIIYKSKVNKFKKSKEMDVYIKANEAEKEIYTQLSQNAKSADRNKKAELKEQYLQMRMAKNQVPDFVKKIMTKNTKEKV